MTEPSVRTEIRRHGDGHLIAVVEVDNSNRLNCLSSDQVVRLQKAFEDLKENDELRAVVLTGAGDKAFIGGADLNELGGLCADSGRLYITRLHQACLAIRDFPLPVIARINGFCLGAGLEVAASCDMRAAAESAVLGMPEVHMGCLQSLRLHCCRVKSAGAGRARYFLPDKLFLLLKPSKWVSCSASHH